MPPQTAYVYERLLSNEEHNLATVYWGQFRFSKELHHHGVMTPTSGVLYDVTVVMKLFAVLERPQLAVAATLAWAASAGYFKQNFMDQMESPQKSSKR